MIEIGAGGRISRLTTVKTDALGRTS